jgi:hypothetical protein
MKAVAIIIVSVIGLLFVACVVVLVLGLISDRKGTRR